jgi:hypothetical protein
MTRDREAVTGVSEAAAAPWWSGQFGSEAARRDAHGAKEAVFVDHATEP